ncbi:MAG: class I SAM-dependent methyltransferase [Acidimicrobiales bacterium]
MGDAETADRRHATSWAPDAEAERYERGRPGYPPDAVAILVRELGLEPGRRVTDVAAGTGKLARELTTSGARVTAIEPMAGMRTQLRLLARVDVVAGSAEGIPLREGTQDGVTVAQAFHWFRLPEASQELRRVLRPGGRLAIVSNQRDDGQPVGRSISEILRRYEDLDPRPAATRQWQDRLATLDDFGPPERFIVPTEQRFATLDDFDARFLSISFAILLDAHSRAAMLDELHRAVEGEPLAVPMRTVIDLRAGA